MTRALLIGAFIAGVLGAGLGIYIAVEDAQATAELADWLRREFPGLVLPAGRPAVLMIASCLVGLVGAAAVLLRRRPLQLLGAALIVAAIAGTYGFRPSHAELTAAINRATHLDLLVLAAPSDPLLHFADYPIVSGAFAVALLLAVSALLLGHRSPARGAADRPASP